MRWLREQDWVGPGKFCAAETENVLKIRFQQRASHQVTIEEVLLAFQLSSPLMNILRCKRLAKADNKEATFSKRNEGHEEKRNSRIFFFRAVLGTLTKVISNQV